MREKLIGIIGKYYEPSPVPTFSLFADHLIANGVTVQEWIPVTERLPEFGQSVIVYDADEGYYGAWEYHGDWIYGDMIWDVDAVTNWMPLPEPPKGE